MRFVKKALNQSCPLIRSISKLAVCNPWSRSGSNYCDTFSEFNRRMIGLLFLVTSITKER